MLNFLLKLLKEKKNLDESKSYWIKKIIDIHNLIRKIHKNQGIIISYEDFEKEL